MLILSRKIEPEGLLLLRRAGSWFVKRRVVSLPQDLFADRGKDVIVIIVADIERQIPVDAFERARAIQTARATRSYAVLDRGFGQMLDHVPGAAAGDPRFVAPPRFPHLRHVPQPQMSRLDIDRHFGDVVQNIRVTGFLLRRHIFQRKVVGRLGGAEKSRAVMRNETSLPPLAHVLSRISDHLVIWDECLLKANQIAYGGSHTDWVPPRAVKVHSRV